VSAEESVVIVVDDDASVRASLRSLLRSVGLKVEDYSSAAEFLRHRLPDSPACLVLDIRMPGLSGLDFQAELARSDVHIPIVFMTGHGDIPMTVKAMKAGAVEFLTKPFRDQDMLDAVQLGLEKDRARRDGDRAVARLRADYDTLTAREREVMALVASGLMNKQVAGKLGVSEITVKLHRGNLTRKMGAKSLADLVRMAETLGLPRQKA
jgi:FixJ family two-component response regulator